MLIGQNSRNAVINGRFDQWQRGLSFTTPANGAYTADRFYVSYDGTIGTFTISQLSQSLGTLPGDPPFNLRWNQTAAGSGSTFRRLNHKIEDVRNYAGKTVTINFYAKADTARTVGTQFTQNFGSGGSPSANVDFSGPSVNLTTSWVKQKVTVAVPSIVGKTLGTSANSSFLWLMWNLPVNTTMTIDIALVSIVEGDNSADFEFAGGSLAGDYRLCQRYYEKSYNQYVSPGTISSAGAYAFTLAQQETLNEYRFGCRFAVTKRANPIMTIYSPVTGTSGQIDTSAGDIAAVTSSIGHEGFTTGLGPSHSSTNGLNYHFTAEAEL